MKSNIIWFSSLLISTFLVYSINSFSPIITSMLYYLFLCFATYLLTEIIYAEANKFSERFSYRSIPVKKD